MSEQRLLNIETTLAFQDDLLTVLNKTVADQQQKIDVLEKQLGMAIERLLERSELMASANIIDEKPPHY